MACDSFADAASSAAKDNGLPAMQIRTVTCAEFYRLRGSVEEIRPLVEGVYDTLVDALLSRLAEEETAASQPDEDDSEPAVIIVTGGSYPEAAEEFNRLYLENRWGDGLPLVPPTPERVRWMLSGTNRSPDEVIGRLEPKQGVITIEKIAVNAVMAGAKPEYLPVIIAVMEALGDERYDERHVLLSAGSFVLMIVVSGPIAREIGMESGVGFLGHGWRPNNTIGRAVRLATINIGHVWPAWNDMALTGRVSPHTFYTFAENSALSVWEPYHAGRGFSPDDSCVTVSTIGGSGPTSNFYGGMIMTWNAKTVLDNIVNDILRTDRRGLRMWGSKGVGPDFGSGGGASSHMIVLFPALVAELNSMGFHRESLQKEIFRRTSIPYEELAPEEVESITTALEKGIVPEDQIEVFKAALKPGGMVPVMTSPEDVHLFVAGGNPGCAFSFNYMKHPPYKPKGILTKRINEAALTKAGAG